MICKTLCQTTCFKIWMASHEKYVSDHDMSYIRNSSLESGRNYASYYQPSSRRKDMKQIKQLAR